MSSFVLPCQLYSCINLLSGLIDYEHGNALAWIYHCFLFDWMLSLLFPFSCLVHFLIEIPYLSIRDAFLHAWTLRNVFCSCFLIQCLWWLYCLNLLCIDINHLRVIMVDVNLCNSFFDRKNFIIYLLLLGRRVRTWWESSSGRVLSGK